MSIARAGRQARMLHGDSMFKHILVPTDFGEPAEHALDVAIEIARKFDAKLTLLHVYQVFVPMPYGEGFTWPIDEIAQRARAHMLELTKKTKARYANCEGIAIPGLVSDGVIEQASESKADLIVMGTHGRRGVPRALLGSVAERVVRVSPVPVLTIGAKASG
jgi:nucleotide-binding universal stress UspA family protein